MPRFVGSGVRALVAVALAACWHCASERPAQIVIATTTSVVNSGLMSHLADQYQKQSGVAIRVHADGSGQGLEMLSDGTVDLVISHAPESESKMIALHPKWHYQKIAANHFLIVGPAEDPAHVSSATTAAEAFRRIATAGQMFVSRGDGSGTHERETQMWTASGAALPSELHPISGTGMAATLPVTDDRRAHTLTADATS